MSDVAKSLLRGAEQALAYVKGEKTDNVIVHKVHVPDNIDVLFIREQLHLDRKTFCEKFGFSIRTVEKWERHERNPEGSARAYLTVISRNPHAVAQALSHG